MPDSGVVNDAAIELRGRSNASTINKQSQLLLTNLIKMVVVQPIIQVQFMERFINASNNIGSLSFGTSSDGSTFIRKNDY